MELKKKKQHSSRRKIGRWWEFKSSGKASAEQTSMLRVSGEKEPARQKKMGRALQVEGITCGDPEARKIRVFEEQQESYVWLESSQRRGSGRRGRMGRKEFW